LHALQLVAQYNLGNNYKLGRGTGKNLAEAVRYYRLAAEQGFANAQFELGCRYELGQGVETDMTAARYWYQLAAGSGHKAAQNKLARCSV
jgi:TPR repeat protein